MLKNLRHFFPVLMLCILSVNSIWELRLTEKTWAMECAEESETEKESENEKNSKTEKEAKKETEEDNFLAINHHLSIQLLAAISDRVMRSAHLYADNLRQVSLTLETPPPEC
jgi:hypothetical protein